MSTTLQKMIANGSLVEWDSKISLQFLANTGQSHSLHLLFLPSKLAGSIKIAWKSNNGQDARLFVRQQGDGAVDEPLQSEEAAQPPMTVKTPFEQSEHEAILLVSPDIPPKPITLVGGGCQTFCWEVALEFHHEDRGIDSCAEHALTTAVCKLSEAEAGEEATLFENKNRYAGELLDEVRSTIGHDRIHCDMDPKQLFSNIPEISIFQLRQANQQTADSIHQNPPPLIVAPSKQPLFGQQRKGIENPNDVEMGNGGVMVALVDSIFPIFLEAETATSGSPEDAASENDNFEEEDEDQDITDDSSHGGGSTDSEDACCHFQQRSPQQPPNHTPTKEVQVKIARERQDPNCDVMKTIAELAASGSKNWRSVAASFSTMMRYFQKHKSQFKWGPKQLCTGETKTFLSLQHEERSSHPIGRTLEKCWAAPLD